MKTKLTLLTAVATIMLANPALAKTKLKLAHYFAETHPQHVALQAFASEIKEKSDGEIVVTVFPNAQLGTEEQMVNGTRNGTIEMSLIGNLVQNLDHKMGLFETPFLLRNYEHARDVLNSDIGDKVAEVFENFDMQHLTYSVSGFRVISSNKKIDKPEDYKGLRLRIPNNQVFVEMGTLLGVNPQTMAFTEVFTALEQGVVDAQENPMGLIKAQGFYEVQKYIIETNHMFTNLNLIMNKKKYDKLSDTEKQIIAEAAENYNKLSWELVEADNNETKEYFKEYGLEVIEPSDDFIKWNQNAMTPLYENLYEKYDWAQDIVERIKAK